MIPDN